MLLQVACIVYSAAKYTTFMVVCCSSECCVLSGLELQRLVALLYRMARNFHGTKFSRDKIFADWLLAKISRKNFHNSMIAKPHLLQEKGVACIVGKIFAV